MASMLGLAGSQHTSGIYSDMTVDGPIIGTLVVVMDRAKNLPNRRTMGKQDPYCAARLGKEAKKTKTDLRGGQTPRWDQELRFTVHDSPDYHNIKVSVFNDDKKTDLIGEAWIPIWEIVVAPGGGQNDAWHGLSYKGKYAGEVRIEMSYYDSREPERPTATPDSLRKRSPVKRRPVAASSPTVIPQFGPRTMGFARGSTAYLDEDGNLSNSQATPSGSYNETSDEPMHNHMQPDFLPQIPPRASRHTPSLPHGHSMAALPPASDFDLPQPQYALTHSYSAPDFHASSNGRPAPSHHYDYSQEESYDYAQSYAGTENAHDTRWQDQSVVLSHSSRDPWDEPTSFEPVEVPPLPPSHSNTPQHDRHRSFDQQSYISSVSPLQNVERSLARPASEYQTPRRISAGPSPLRRELPGPPSHSHPQSNPTSPFSRSVGSSPGAQQPASYLQHPGINRQSVSDPYMTTPPRGQPHPLSHEVPRSTSPQPYHGNQGYEEPNDYHFPQDLPLVKPRPIPSPRQRHSIASIQHPISSFASSPASTPGDIRQLPRSSERITPTRKEVSRPTPPGSEPSRFSIPFSPDSFDAYNPAARSSHLDAQPNPHNPYHIPESPKRNAKSKDTTRTDRNPNDPIVGFDGRVIDPSDHLPVDSWAPEPEAKNPVKTYAGSSHAFGPRTVQASPSTPGSGPRKSNLVVNVRTRNRLNSVDNTSPIMTPSPPIVSPVSPTRGTDGRNRLVKKNSPVRSPILGTDASSPLREIEIPNPYAGGNMRSSPSSFGGFPTSTSHRSYDDMSYYNGSEYGSNAGSAPPKPPKIPFDGVEGSDRFGYGTSALSKEMAKIDIGGIGAGRRAPPRNGGRSAAVGMRFS